MKSQPVDVVPTDPPPPPPKKARAALVGISLLIIALAGLAWYLVR